VRAVGQLTLELGLDITEQLLLRPVWNDGLVHGRAFPQLVFPWRLPLLDVVAKSIVAPALPLGNGDLLPA
jgi:hypothetical protein